MGNETQMKQEGGTGTGWSWTGYQYGNSNTMKKPSFKRNIANLEDTVFDYGRLSDTVKNEDSTKPLISYIQRECSLFIYLGQAIWEVKVPDLVLPIKPMKDNNQSDADFDMGVF